MSIEIKHVSLTLGNKVLLNDVSVAIHSGELTIILGPNGTGKSSLLKIFSQEWPCNGELNIYGKHVDEWSLEQLAESVGILPQYSSLTFSFTVKEVVEMGGLSLRASQKTVAAIAEGKMQQTEVMHLANRLYPTLSGGEKQRVHLARVLTQLSQSPRNTVLMLDEPTSALDIGHQHKTLRLAKQLTSEGSTVIAVIHDLNLAAQYADRIIMLHDGKIVADGNPRDVLTSQHIENVYGWPVQIIQHPLEHYPVILA